MSYEQRSFKDAARKGHSSLLGEFIGFMRDNSKWWLIPFVIVFGLLGVALLVGATGAAPFIYTLF